MPAAIAAPNDELDFGDAEVDVAIGTEAVEITLTPERPRRATDGGLVH
jgi:hypothetical protein